MTEGKGALRKWNYSRDLLLFRSRLGPDSNNNGRGEGAGRRGPPRSPEIVGFVFRVEVVSSSKIFFGIRKGDERDVEPRTVFFFLVLRGKAVLSDCNSPGRGGIEHGMDRSDPLPLVYQAVGL